jgi:signal transduction histidine kinase
MPMGARTVVLAAAALCAPVLYAGAQVPTGPHRTVLVINLGAENFPANPLLDAGIREVFASSTDVGIDCFSEYLESDLFPGEGAEGAFRDYLRRKYEDRRIDLVIALTDTVLRFAVEHRAELFPEAPIVFMGLAGPDEQTRIRGPGVTGVRVGTAYRETLQLALHLQPATEQVFVVAMGRDEQTLQAVRSEVRTVSQKVRITFVSEDSIPALLAAIRAAPPRSVILYIWHTEQQPGQVRYPDEVARLVSQAAPVAVYGTSDLYIGTGVLGGVMRGTRATGIRLGDIALRVLRGTHAGDIPIESARVEPILDWRQLRRWNISEARVPDVVQLRFREPGVWDQYKHYIVGAVAVLLAQSGLIGALLLQAKRRRRAEARIRDLGSRLLGAQEAERSRIARELHDDVSQQATLLAIDLQAIGRSGRGHKDIETLTREAVERTEAIARSLHDLSHRLHPAKLKLMGLVPSLQGLCREFPEGVSVRLSYENVPPSLPNDLTLSIFRIVQEALHNAVRHGGARKVSVDLGGTGTHLALTIVDDGSGFDVEAVSAKGLGLISMRERLEPLGGTLKIQSRPGAGTRLEILVPVSPPAARSPDPAPPGTSSAQRTTIDR